GRQGRAYVRREFLRHEQAGQDQPGGSGRQASLRKGLGETRTVLPSPHQTEDEGALRDAGQGVWAAVRIRGWSSLTEVASVAHLARHVGRKAVLAHRVVNPRIPIDPDGIVVIEDGFDVRVGGPFAVHSPWMFELVAE